MRKGEESVEMGGYFICNGIERIIRMITLQRRHYIMALRRGAFRKRGANYTDAATTIRYCLLLSCHLVLQICVDCSLSRYCLQIPLSGPA